MRAGCDKSRRAGRGQRVPAGQCCYPDGCEILFLEVCFCSIQIFLGQPVKREASTWVKAVKIGGQEAKRAGWIPNQEAPRQAGTTWVQAMRPAQGGCGVLAPIM